MEIIFNKDLMEAITGKLRKKSGWFIRSRNGKFHAAYLGPEEDKIKSFKLFYSDLMPLQSIHYISQIILTDQERRWLNE